MSQELELKEKAQQHITISIEELSKLCQSIISQNITQQTQAQTEGKTWGNPGALGLAGFALTTFTLSCFNAGVIIDAGLLAVVLPLALFYGGMAQFIAGLFEFKLGNTFGATAFCSYGSFWMSFAAYIWFVVPLLNAGDASEATGLFLFVWTIFTLYMTVGSWRTSVAVMAVFFTLSITLILLTIGTLAKSASTTEAGGWFGLLCACCAWYASAAFVINSTWKRVISGK